MKRDRDHPAAVAADAASASMTQRAREDRTLMEAIARREPAALEALYQRYSACVMGHCLRALNGDRAEAEETVEQIFWEIWSKPDRYDPTRGAVLTYLLTLTHSRATDRLRAMRRTRATVSLDAHRDGAAGGAAASAGDAVGAVATAADARHGGDPIHGAMLTEARDRVRRSLAALEPEQRQVVELAFFSGMSHSEIAARLSQPLGTVKTRIRTGLNRLRESLRAAYGTEISAPEAAAGEGEERG